MGTATRSGARFGDLLRSLRLRAGLTQEGLAEAAGLSARGLSDLERGLSARPQLETVRLLGQALRLTEEDKAALLAAARPEEEPRPGDATRPPLPAPPTPLIGRKRELVGVAAALRGEARLVTLTGPGGVGKSHLALAAAGELLAAGAFPDGAAFVALAPLADPDLVPAAAAAALGVHEAGDRPPGELLRGAVGAKRLLLVLDNCEHVVDAVAALVADLLATCPNLTVLATTRVLLRLRAEREFPVPPLGLPRRKPPPPPEQLTQYDAVRLFIARAAAVRPGFAVDNDTAPAVAEICWRLDGLPLAIELAAARVRLLPVPRLLERLEQRLPLLTGGPRDAPARQRTLRDAIAWSYDLLPPGDQALLRRLAVFAGGCSLEAAEAVADPDGALGAFAGLERLLEASLLRHEADAAGEPRFATLETVREFALEQLEANGEAAAVRRRHAAFFAEMAESARESLIGGTGQGAWVARLEVEHDNFRGALLWALGDDPDAALRMAGPLGRFWLWGGHLAEGRRWIERACERASRDDAAAWALALEALAKIRQTQGHYGPGAGLAQEALARWREVGDRHGEGRALTAWADAVGDGGDGAQALALYEEALAIARELDDRRGIYTTTNNMGVEVLASGEWERAAGHFEEALDLAREHGDEGMASTAVVNLAEAALHGDQRQRAAALYAEALAATLASGDRIGQVLALRGMGFAASTSDPARAAYVLGAATAIGEAMGMAALSPTEIPLHERAVAAMRASLGEGGFAVAWSAGAALSLEEAVAEALAERDESGKGGSAAGGASSLAG